MRKVALTCILFSIAFGMSPVFAQPTVDWGGKPPGADWSRFVQESIEADNNRLVSTIPRDIARFCPNYERLPTSKRREVWARMFSLLAFYESRYNPSLHFTENFKDAQGRWVISRGLLQISKESANGSRYKCRIASEASLHDPRINLSCGTKIAAAWVTTDSRIFGRTATGEWRGMARYWSPFRDDAKRRKIAALLSATTDCK